MHYRNVVSRLQGKKVFFEEASVWPWLKSVRSQTNSHEGEKEGIGEQVGIRGSREKVESVAIAVSMHYACVKLTKNKFN